MAVAEKPVTEKVTFVLPSELVKRMRAVVEQGQFTSQSSLVKAALASELRRAREAQLAREYEEAARDPLFIADMEECMHDFRFVDAEAAAMIPFDEDFDKEMDAAP